MPPFAHRLAQSYFTHHHYFSIHDCSYHFISQVCFCYQFSTNTKTPTLTMLSTDLTPYVSKTQPAYGRVSHTSTAKIHSPDGEHTRYARYRSNSSPATCTAHHPHRSEHVNPLYTMKEIFKNLCIVASSTETNINRYTHFPIRSLVHPY